MRRSVLGGPKLEDEAGETSTAEEAWKNGAAAAELSMWSTSWMTVPIATLAEM